MLKLRKFLPRNTLFKTKSRLVDAPFVCTLEWSVPLRKTGKSSLSTIPEDVYRMIFEHIQPPDATTRTQYTNLALVCRFFCAVFVPLLYQSMELRTSEMEQTDSQTKQTIGGRMTFYHRLVEDRETSRSFGAFVKNFSVTGSGRTPTNYLPRLPEILERLGGIERLSLEAVLLNTELFAVLAKLKKLTSLTISSFDIDADNMSFPQGPPLELRHLALFSGFTGLTTDFAESLSAFMSSSNIRVLQVDNDQLLLAFVSSAPEICVEDLQVHQGPTQDLRVLFKAFHRMPSITTLSVSVYSSRSQQLIRNVLSPSSLPNLSVLRCPLFLANELIPGRPLRQIHLIPTISEQSFEDVFGVSVEDSCCFFSALKQSTVPITSLRIQNHVYFAAPSSGFPPDLKSLHLDYPSRMSSREQFINCIDALCKTGSMMPPVTDLLMDFDAPVCGSEWISDFALQYQMVQSLQQRACPTLRRVVLNEGLEWSIDTDKTWHSRLSGKLEQLPKEGSTSAFWCRRASCFYCRALDPRSRSAPVVANHVHTP